MVMAHRGDSVNAPENTLPAFQSAIDRGADAAELDVQMTKDGVIVVMHDDSLKRTAGVDKKIWDVTYNEIKDLDAGSFFSSKYEHTHIPTLQQVIDLCKGKLYLNIEIKRTGHDEGIEKKVLNIIEMNHLEDQCDITSMDYQTIVNVHELNPEVKTVYTTTVAYGSLTSLTAADAFSIEGSFVNADFVTSLKKNNKEIYVWTIDDPDTMQKMIDLDVDAIITNDPETCRSLVDSRYSLTSVAARVQTVLKGN